MTLLRLFAVLNTGFKTVGARHAVPKVAEQRTPCTDTPLAHFASPPGEKNGPGGCSGAVGFASVVAVSGPDLSSHQPLLNQA